MVDSKHEHPLYVVVGYVTQPDYTVLKLNTPLEPIDLTIEDKFILPNGMVLDIVTVEVRGDKDCVEVKVRPVNPDDVINLKPGIAIALIQNHI